MSPRSFVAEVKPELLRWARETAGLRVTEVARSLSKVDRWEQGIERPTVRQLETLSDLYKRPLACFFLPTPPIEPLPPNDFRVLPGEESRTLSKKVRLALRKGRRTQRLYVELNEALGLSRPPSLPRISVSGGAETHATDFRGLIGVSVQEQFAWADAYEAFRKWRIATETIGALVLQLNIPVKEARGFSLSEGLIPTIVVSSSDAVHGRIFTLFHEIGHVLLNSGGICIPDPTDLVEPNQVVEQFCNHFAGAFLVPLDALRSHPDLNQLPSAPQELDERLEHAARAFKASRQVILRRLLVAGIITREFFRHTMDRWLSSEPSPERRGRGQRPAARVISQLGAGFVSAVLEAHGRGLITSGDVADYLSLNLKHLPAVHKLVGA
jgi:Zn-dependent peptidase ImmA (M78 family)/transcriptional regulator with XRE-family HTH domain